MVHRAGLDWYVLNGTCVDSVSLCAEVVAASAGALRKFNAFLRGRADGTAQLIKLHTTLSTVAGCLGIPLVGESLLRILSVSHMFVVALGAYATILAKSEPTTALSSGVVAFSCAITLITLATGSDVAGLLVQVPSFVFMMYVGYKDMQAGRVAGGWLLTAALAFALGDPARQALGGALLGPDDVIHMFFAVGMYAFGKAATS